MEFHPLSNLFPLMHGAAFEALKRDISANGLREPIVTLGGQILDGRNRWRVCEAIEVAPMCVEWSERYENDSPLSFAISMNVHRRHLIESQRAMVADRLATLPRGFVTALESDAQICALTQDEAADLLNVARRSVQFARKVREKGIPKLADAVDSGILAVSSAALLADKPAKFQKEICKELAANNGINVSQRIKEYDREQRRLINAALVQQNHAPLTDLGVHSFSTIVIDPPWDAGVSDDNDIMGRSRPTYATMQFDEIAALQVGELAAPDAHIYLWVTNRVLPLAFELLDRWDFRYVTTLTWCKPSIGMGNYFRGSTEHVLFGVRGKLPLLRNDLGTWFAAARPSGHSAKPPEFFEMVEQCSTGPWVELFARNERPGWASWGAEV